MLAEILRQRGYDAVHVLDLERTGKTDAEQLEFAVSQNDLFSPTIFEIFLGLIGIIGQAVENTSAYYSPIK